MATGDIQANVERVRQQLCRLRCPLDVDCGGLGAGDHRSLLPLLGFALTAYSKPLAATLAAAGFELRGKSDARFLETVLKISRDVFSLRPSLTLPQILDKGFAERKLHLLHDILSNCHNYHQQAKRRERLASIRPLQARSIQQSTSWGTPPGTGTAEQSSQLPQQRPEQQQQQHRRSLAGRRDQLTASHSFSISVEEHQQDDPFNAPSCSKPAQPLSSTGLGPEADAKAALDRSSSSAAAAAASQPSCAPGRKKQAKQTQRRCLQSPASTRSKLQTHVPPAEQPCPNSEQGQAPCKSQPHHARPEGSAHALDHSRPRLPTPQEACACCGTPALTSAAAQATQEAAGQEDAQPEPHGRTHQAQAEGCAHTMSTDHEGAAGACDQADTHGFGAGALAELLTRVARLEGQSRECRTVREHMQSRMAVLDSSVRFLQGDMEAYHLGFQTPLQLLRPNPAVSQLPTPSQSTGTASAVAGASARQQPYHSPAWQKQPTQFSHFNVADPSPDSLCALKPCDPVTSSAPSQHPKLGGPAYSSHGREAARPAEHESRPSGRRWQTSPANSNLVAFRQPAYTLLGPISPQQATRHEEGQHFQGDGSQYIGEGGAAASPSTSHVKSWPVGRTGATEAPAQSFNTAPADLVMLAGSNIAEQIASRLQAAQQTLLQLRGTQAVPLV